MLALSEVMDEEAHIAVALVIDALVFSLSISSYLMPGRNPFAGGLQWENGTCRRLGDDSWSVCPCGLYDTRVKIRSIRSVCPRKVNHQKGRQRDGKFDCAVERGVGAAQYIFLHSSHCVQCVRTIPSTSTLGLD
jgi:hypothetical protein